MDAKPGRLLENVIYVIESNKLKFPTIKTLKMLQRAKVVITDPSENTSFEMII